MKLASSLLALVLATAVWAQVSPYTGVAVVPPDSNGHYRLLFGGHFHGASANMSGYPAATVLAGLDLINTTGANALLSTGDLYLRPQRDSLRYASSFFGKLRLPLFNAPGNHDLEGGAWHPHLPQRINMGRDRILLLDTERDNSDVKGEQLEALRTIVAEAAAGEVDHVFIVSHRPVWAENDDRYGPLFAGNTRSITGANFESVVYPLLREAATKAEVFWISGSMAGRAPASVFFQPHEHNITYIQSAVRDELRDALLLAEVGPGGVQWKVLSLTGEVTRPAATYDAAWWQANRGQQEAFNWRRLPYLIKKNTMAPAFWYGALTVLFLVLLTRRFLRRGRGAQD